MLALVFIKVPFEQYTPRVRRDQEGFDPVTRFFGWLEIYYTYLTRKGCKWVIELKQIKN